MIGYRKEYNNIKSSKERITYIHETKKLNSYLIIKISQ